MGRKSCRKQRKEQLVPQAAVATPLPPLPPGSPPSREIWDWLVHPEGNFAFDLPCVISTLCLRDGERWADWEKQHNPASVRDLTMVVLGYLAADMGGIPPRGAITGTSGAWHAFSSPTLSISAVYLSSLCLSSVSREVLVNRWPQAAAPGSV
ncbi:UNVERIFIED_CONTAM: hypothetical protein FKN15_039861 [Acipenser sinensis]